MTDAAALRRYTLTLARAGDGVEARVSRAGPANPLAWALGRTVEEALRLLPAVFPICPRAHAVAFLRAVADAAGTPSSSVDGAAHDALVLSEALAAAAFRTGVATPQRLGAPVDADAVGPALAASAACPKALFDGPWTPGAAQSVAPDMTVLERIATDLSDALERLAAGAEAHARAAAAILLKACAPCPPLGEDILDPAITPAQDRREETPRSVIANAPPAPQGPAQNAAEWFRAQTAYAKGLLEDLEHTIPALDATRTAPPPAAVTGEGVGLALTARGRLRHHVALADGRITAWRADAPTDWNLAPDGPLARAAAALAEPDALASAGAVLVAAFDPCAPCAVEVEELAYA